jgi:hypothetical protein
MNLRPPSPFVHIQIIRKIRNDPAGDSTSIQVRRRAATETRELRRSPFTASPSRPWPSSRRHERRPWFCRQLRPSRVCRRVKGGSNSLPLPIATATEILSSVSTLCSLNLDTRRKHCDVLPLRLLHLGLGLLRAGTNVGLGFVDRNSN